MRSPNTSEVSGCICRIDDLPREIPHVRQWLCVPPTASATPNIPQLQDFHVLLETQRGRLVLQHINYDI